MVNKYSKFINDKKYYRIAGLFFIVFALAYLVWLFTKINPGAKWLSYPYFLAQTYIYLLVTLSIINHWSARYRTRRPKLPKNPPPVAVIVSNYNEPVKIVKRTVKSLLHLSYPTDIVIVVSNGKKSKVRMRRLEKMMEELSSYWNKNLRERNNGYKRNLHLRYSDQNGGAKADNLNNTVDFLRKHYPNIDLILTQDADEIAYPDLLKAIVGYFNNPNVAYVQTIKQAKVIKDDPFGNHDLMWYCRTAPSRDVDNAMFACGSGVIWRISALESIGGFSTWNLVEDLTTSYELLAKGWGSVYHYEALSEGLAPEDLPNYLKQRGTWAVDSLRLFFWNNPIFKKGLTLKQKLQFIETNLFYINGIVGLLLVILVSVSLTFHIWPTTASATTHALYLAPSFIAMEIYFLLLADKIPYRRIRQFWIGLAPVFALSAFKAVINGPNNKPKYTVTRKENEFGNYFKLVLPQIAVLGLVVISLLKTILSTPLYSQFDWGVFFWGLYLATFYLQIIKVSWWKWKPEIYYELTFVNQIQLTYLKAKSLLQSIESRVGTIVNNKIPFAFIKSNNNDN